MPAMSRVGAIPVASGTGDVQAYTGKGRLYGFSIREAVAAAASIILRDGTADTAPILAVISLAASSSQTVWFGEDGIRFDTGVFVDRVSGTTEGAVYVG